MNSITNPPDFKWRRFQGEIILWAVRWYCKYGVSYRNLEEMFCEPGLIVDHTTIYRWVQLYTPEIEKRLRWYWSGHPFQIAGMLMKHMSKLKADGLTCIEPLIRQASE